MMSTELISSKQGIEKYTGGVVLQKLSESMVDIEVRDDQGRFIEKIPSSLKSLNEGMKSEDVDLFLERCDEEMRDRSLGLIKSKTFELAKATSVLKSLRVYVDPMQSPRPRSWDAVDKLDAPSLYTIRKYKSEQDAVAVVFFMLKQFSLKFGKRNLLSEGELKELSVDMVEYYGELSLAEIKLMISRSLVSDRNSRKIYNLDYVTMASLLNDLRDERSDRALRISERDHDQYKAQVAAQAQGRQSRKDLSVEGMLPVRSEELSHEEKVRIVKGE